MIDSHESESRLDRLGRDLSERPSVVEAVMAEIETARIESPSVRKDRSTASATTVRAMSIATAVCVLLRLPSFFCNPKRYMRRRKKL